LFLIELHRQTGEVAYAHTALGALRDAIGLTVESHPVSIGLYAGRTGVAWVCALSGALGTDEHVAQVPGLLDEARWVRGAASSFDVIAGTAGSIVGNLLIAEILHDPACVERAITLGQTLINDAFRGPDGWSWGAPTLQHSRNLTGLAHGAAGVGWSLAELYAATGEGRFLYAAEQAVAYEQARYDARQKNWPDLRIQGLSEFLDKPSRISAAVEADPSLLERKHRFMAAWCHGAPGIALARFRMYDLLAASSLLNEALTAARTTAASMRRNVRGHEYSLCHGATGKCDALFSAMKHMDACDRSMAQFHSITRECIGFGIERYGSGRAPWPCGTWGRETDPSLMVGEAGIGLWYLGMHAPDTVSATLPHPRLTPQCPAVLDHGYERLRAESVHEYFGRTIAFMNGSNLEIAMGPRQTLVDATYLSLKRAAALGTMTVEAREAFVFERRKWKLARSEPGWPKRLLALLAGLPDQIPRSWHVQLADEGVDLTAWAEDDIERASATVVAITPVACEVKELRGATAFVLANARRPLTVEDLIELVARQRDRASAEVLVEEHVRTALLDGLLVRIYPSGSRS
jgi:hypothetical protein